MAEIIPIPRSDKNKHENRLWDELNSYGRSPRCDPSMELGSDFPIWDNGIQKRIDAIGKRGEFTYIIEIKQKLNFEAIGQVFVYEYLYQKHLKKKNLKEKIKKGICCENADDHVFLSFCSQKDIVVFELTKNGIKEHPPNAF